MDTVAAFAFSCCRLAPGRAGLLPNPKPPAASPISLDPSVKVVHAQSGL